MHPKSLKHAVQAAQSPQSCKSSINQKSAFFDLVSPSQGPAWPERGNPPPKPPTTQPYGGKRIGTVLAGKAPRNRNVKKKDHPLTTCSLRHHLFRPSVSSGGIQPRKSNRRNKSFQGFLHGANLDRAPWGEVNQSAAARLAISKPNIWHMAFLRRTYGPRGAQHKTRFG